MTNILKIDWLFKNNIDFSIILFLVYLPVNVYKQRRKLISVKINVL